MAERLQVYKCERCGNVVEVLTGGAGELVCCGVPMQLLEEKTADAAVEKHVPVIEKVDAGVRVKVGSVPHPMEAEHYIEWIELLSGDTVLCRRYLKPGDAPEALLCCPPACNCEAGEPLTAREHCNVHGLWKG